jgi:hypothetical protein
MTKEKPGHMGSGFSLESDPPPNGAMSKLFTRFAGWFAWAFGHPLAFILACLATAAWAVT